MKKIEITLLVTMLLMTIFALPVLANSVQYERQIENKTSVNNDVNLDVCITTDYVNGWQDHGLRIKEYDVGDNVWLYTEFSGDDLFGIHMSTDWYYDSGSGMEYKFSWWWDVDGHYESAYMWAWEPMSDYYGPGYGYMEVWADQVLIGQSNFYAIGNTQPNKPTIVGDTSGAAGEEYEYIFLATDPDGFDISYYVDWGDETNSGWTDFVASGTELKLKHTWAEQGDYAITCKVKDLVDNESEEATLAISMPKNKAFNFNLLESLFERFPNVAPLLRYLLGL